MPFTEICAENCRRLNELDKKVSEEIGKNQAEHEAFVRRLSGLEEDNKQMNGILVTLQKQADNIKAVDLKVDNMAANMNNISSSIRSVDSRLDRIEKEPGER